MMKYLLAGAALVVAVLIVAYAVYVSRLNAEVARVKAFCDDVKGGTPVSELAAIADRHGIDKRWLEGTYLEKEKTWFFFVPVTASVGELGCAVRHDGKKVLSAAM